MKSGRAKQGLVALAAAFVAASVFYAPAFFDVHATGFGDWLYFHHMWEVASVAFERYGEVALYDPHQCGGVPLWGDPQAQTYGPWFLLSLLTGTTIALKTGVIVHAALGFFGAYQYARQEHGLAEIPSALAALVFIWTGFFAWHIAGGHAAFLPFYFAPLLALHVRRAFSDRRSIAFAALLLALTVYEGGVYPLSFMLLVVALETFFDRERA